MTAGRRFANRRRSESFSFTCGGQNYHATVSWFDTGEIGEIFISNSKPASQSDVNARDAAIAASLAFQHGCPASCLAPRPTRKGIIPLGQTLDIMGGEE